MARYALCIGISYGNALAGTLTDVDAIGSLLAGLFRILPSQVRVLMPDIDVRGLVRIQCEDCGRRLP